MRVTMHVNTYVLEYLSHRVIFRGFCYIVWFYPKGTHVFFTDCFRNVAIDQVGNNVWGSLDQMYTILKVDKISKTHLGV